MSPQNGGPAAAGPIPEEIKRSTRNPEALHQALQAWLSDRLKADAPPEVSEVTSPSATGMSSETLLFDARWHDGGREQAGVLRRAAGARPRRLSGLSRLRPEGPVDSVIFHRPTLEKMLDGSWWR